MNNQSIVFTLLIINVVVDIIQTSLINLLIIAHLNPYSDDNPSSYHDYMYHNYLYTHHHLSYLNNKLIR